MPSLSSLLRRRTPLVAGVTVVLVALAVMLADAGEDAIEHGGRVFVRADQARACSGLRLIQASAASPPDIERYARADVDGLSVFVRPAAGRQHDSGPIGSG